MNHQKDLIKPLLVRVDSDINTLSFNTMKFDRKLHHLHTLYQDGFIDLILQKLLTKKWDYYQPT